MLARFRLPSSCLATVAALALALTAATSSLASTPHLAPGPEQELFEAAITSRCVPPAAHDVLRSYSQSIDTAPSVDAARALVLEQTALARRALRTASWLLPFSDTIADLQRDLDTLEHRVFAAATQTEVASDFLDALAVPAEQSGYETSEEPVMLASTALVQSAVTIGDGGGCNYTVVEILIIIIGFLLFIIPGIIFLILLC